MKKYGLFGYNPKTDNIGRTLCVIIIAYSWSLTAGMDRVYAVVNRQNIPIYTLIMWVAAFMDVFIGWKALLQRKKYGVYAGFIFGIAGTLLYIYVFPDSILSVIFYSVLLHILLFLAFRSKWHMFR